MAFKHGKNAIVWVGSGRIGSYLTGADFTFDVDAADTTTFGATWKTAIHGTAGSTLALTGYYDPAFSSFPDFAGEPDVWTYGPSGGAIGDGARLLNGINVSYSKSSPVGGVVAFTITLQATGAVGLGEFLHTYTTDTNTTTGATKTDAAATATGWMAHLHVAGVTAGSWVVKLEDSADGSTWADVTGGAFTAATGATAQRLVSAAADTALRRYVRYTATRTGGAASDSITFLLAYARNT